MTFSFLAKGLRRFVDLFKSSDRHEHDNSRGPKYHLVPSWGPSLPTLPLFTTASTAAPHSTAPACTAPPRAHSYSAIIAKLLGRTRAETANPVLSTHTLTVTSVGEIQPLIPSGCAVIDIHDHGDMAIVTETDHKIRDVPSAVEPGGYVDEDDDNVSLPPFGELHDTAEGLPTTIEQLSPTVEKLLPIIGQLVPSADDVPSTTEQAPVDDRLGADEQRLTVSEQLRSTIEQPPSDEPLSVVAENSPQVEWDVLESSETTACDDSTGEDEVRTGDEKISITSDNHTKLTGALCHWSLSDTSVDDDAATENKAVGSSDERIALSGLADADSDKVDHGEHGDENLMDEYDTSSESSDDEEDNLVDPDVLRADWAAIQAISKRSFRLALLQHLPPDSNVTVDDIRCVRGIQGGFNFVRILQVGDGPSSDRYAIKVPCTGTSSRWQDSDAYMLRNDAQTMSYISKHTDVLCSEVIGFSDNLSNILGAPYIAMRANDGIPSSDIWFDRDEDGTDDVDNACTPYETRMRIRVNFLRSLATQMAKLQALEFDKAGTLNFDHDPENPVIGPTYHWKTISEMCKLRNHDMSTPASINRVPAFTTGKEYFTSALDEHWPRKEDVTDINKGRRSIMEFILASAPSDESAAARDEKETFVLRHDDLDFQNVLCDEEGNVTAIIDWDKCRAVPRCVGFASLPVFLIKDWAPKLNTNVDIHMPWELIEYRSVYAQAMLEATGREGDGKYTVKSHIYEAVHAALYGGHNGGSVPVVVHKMILEMPGTRQLEDMDVLMHLGGGDWPYGKFKIEAEVRKTIAPQSGVEEVEPWFYVEPEK